MSGRPFLTHGSGYLVNDNRNSGGGKEECDVGLCPHCQKVIKLQEWRDISTGMNGWCMKCMLPCCINGACGEDFKKNGCLPFLKRIEKLMDAEYARSQFRKVAGLEPEQQLFTYPGKT
jgi:hypothetical protein